MKKIPFWIELTATGFYLGKIPVMPGTFGSLAAIPLGYAASFLTRPYKWVLFTVVLLAGIYVSDRFEKLGGVKDPGCVVIDEIAALLLVYIVFPFSPFYVAWGFVFFRLFDILKPFPVKYFENLPGGIGIMADDLMAAVYACLACAALHAVFRRFFV